jgi:hypothetical protein
MNVILLHRQTSKFNFFKYKKKRKSVDTIILNSYNQNETLKKNKYTISFPIERPSKVYSMSIDFTAVAEFRIL